MLITHLTVCLLKLKITVSINYYSFVVYDEQRFNLIPNHYMHYYIIQSAHTHTHTFKYIHKYILQYIHIYLTYILYACTHIN